MNQVQLLRLPVCVVFVFFAALMILYPLPPVLASDMFLMPTLKTPEEEISKIPSEEPPTSGQSEETWSGAVSEVGKNDLKSGDPIVTGSGSMDYRQLIFQPGGPMNLSVSFIYNRSINNWWQKMKNYFPANNFHNYFWISPLSGINDYGSMTDVRLPDGSMVSFEKEGESYALNEDQNGSPVRYAAKTSGNPADRFWVQDPVNDRIYLYEFNASNPGDILYILDRNGNKLTYTYDGNDRISQISDGLGRTVEFGFQTYMHSISDNTDAGNPRTVTFGYEPDPDMDDKPALRTITDPLNHTRTFHWSKVVHGNTNYYDNLVKVENPRGDTFFHFENTWEMVFYKDDMGTDRSGVKVTEQKDAFGNTTQFHYNPDPYLTLAVYPDGTYGGYAHDNAYVPPGSFTDATGEYMAFEKNAANQIERTIDREGGQTQISYHAGSGKIASATNARNKGMTYTYTAQEQTFADPVTPANQVTFTFYNLTRVDYPDGTYETFTHDDKGNILSHTDPANTHPEGTPWIYTYNEKGQVQTRENPEGGVTTFTYNNDGTLASVTDTDTGQTSYGHDGFKRLTGITRPDSGTVEIQYDLNDRITVVTDERNNTYTYTYDANGNLAEITDPDNNKTEFTHDKMDRVSGTTDARTQASQFTYDIMNRLKKATDPNTSTLEYGYDTRGWLNSVTDGQGYAWTTGHDKEGLPITRTTPLGRTATITRDALGQIIEQIDPQGNKTTFNRDDASRVTRITDPEDRETVYAYDDAGRLTGVTLPDNKTSQYRRNGLGLVDRITDRGGSQWHLDYTGMGRLAALTDPLNNKWEYTYDTTGRPETVTFPDGSVLTRTHDKAGNLTKNRYTDGQGQALDLEFTWDKHNRLLTAENIAFSYNETGQITTTTNPGTAFGAAYDNGGRLITATYANGLFSVTYTYNARNLLTRVTDSLTNAAIDFTYDNDSRLTGMTRSGGSGASGTDTTFTWDDASRLTRIQHGTLADLSYTLNKAGDITQLTYTLPLDPADYLATDIGTLAFDAGSQITSAGYGYGAQGRQTQSPYDTFTWDKASRITAISQTNLAYNGLNDLLTRQADGTTVRFYYNYALGLEPAVAEKNETAQAWKRFYILTPAGQLLYLIDASNSNAVSFYHFDRTGNTLFLTDETGNITDCYAYSPYGKLLAHSGTSDQPYTFAGAWQARKEGDNGIYQMRARYYDAGTARFLSRESQWPVIHEPHDLNPYQYARMNPVMYVDPEGTAPEPAGEERIGLKIGFSEKYACPVHKIWLDQLIQRRKELREAIEKLGLMGGWSRTRIDNEIKKELQEATWDLSNFQKAIVLKKGEGIDLNAVKIVEGLSGQFGQARWFAERHGERVFLGEGNTLRLDQEQVQQLKDHFGSDVNIVLESDYSDQEGTDTFTQKANAVFDGF